MARALVQLAEIFFGGKILVSLEGGYNYSGMMDGVFAVLSELVDRDIETGFASRIDNSLYNTLKNEQYLNPMIEEAREVAKKYWKM